MNVLIAIIASYLLGSIPTAYWAGRLLKGIDIRQHGSGNVGATNASRVLGKGPGVVVFMIDVLKGSIPILFFGDIFQLERIGEHLLLAVAVVCGHNWTVFLQFKGGKGIATSLGVLIGLTIKISALRTVLFYTILTWFAVFLVSGYVSLASIVAGTILPVFMIFTRQVLEVTLLGALFSVFIIIRHRSNIKRLLAGHESRVSLPLFSRKKK